MMVLYCILMGVEMVKLGASNDVYIFLSGINQIWLPGFICSKIFLA